MKKALFVATVVKTHIMTFHTPYLKMLQEMGYETAVAAKNDYTDPAQCNIPYCDTYFDVPFERSPLKVANWTAFRQLKKIIDEGNYDLIHCHTPVGAMLTRFAAIGARKRGTKVLYTAHGFHFYKGAPLLNWLIYFPIEWVLAHFTDVLITMNREDYDRAKRMGAKKSFYVPGVGVDITKFDPDRSARKKKRAELGVSATDLVLLSVGELNTNKNHRVVIEALAQIADLHIRYIVCGQGMLMQELNQIAEELGVADRVLMTGYRQDIAEYLQAADVFVFPSRREGLPVAIEEAMASGLPVICSNIRGNVDLIQDHVSGLVVENDPTSVAGAIKEMADFPEKRTEYAGAARENIKDFSLENVKSIMRDIYVNVD